MREIKRDLITNDIVVVAKDRANRPMDKIKGNEDIEIDKEYEEKCPFCRGNENETDESTYEIKDNNGWITRSVYNKYPIVSSSSCGVSGVHEVIIDTYRHNGSFYNMSEDEFFNLFKMYKNRYIDLAKYKDTEYISLFKNFLRKAGASLLHPHSQIVSLSMIPPDVENEINISKKYYDKNKKSLYKKIVEDELEYKERIIYDDEDYIVIVPEVSKYGGEIRVIFKDNIRFENLDEVKIKSLSVIFNKLFKNIYNIQGYNPFNILIHTHPIKLIDDEDVHYHAHIHIIPRKYSFGGFELSTNMYISSLNASSLADSLRFNENS